MDRIIEALKQKYHPLGMIVYGSFANGTNNLNSDFDALILTSFETEHHDHSQILGTELDVFVYPRSKFTEPFDIEEFVQVWDGLVVMDETGLLEKLKQQANAYIRQYPGKTRAENDHNLFWCKKMLARTKRDDMEGRYRLYWLLKDSLEIWFDLKGQYFFGPKKALQQMKEADPGPAAVYYAALNYPSYENVSKWISCLEHQFDRCSG